MKNEKIKLLVVSQYFWPEPNHLLLDLVNELKKKDFNVDLLTSFPNYPYGKLYKGYKQKLIKIDKFNNSEIFRFPTYPYKGYNKIKRFLNYTIFSMTSSFLSPFFCPKYDLIFCYQTSPIFTVIPAIILKKVYQSKLIIWVQDLWPDTLVTSEVLNNSSVIYKFISLLTGILYREADLIIVESKGFINSFANKGIKKEKIKYLPNWPVTVQSNNIVNKDIQDKKYFNILYAGNVGYNQNLSVLLDVAKLIISECPNIKFTIVGDGDEYLDLKNRVERENISNVNLIGRVPPAVMAIYYNQADALFLQLRKDPLFAKTIPSKLQTYMFNGKPIIAASEGSIAEIIQDAKCGIVCIPEDAKSIYNGILKLYNMPKEEREILGLNGLNYAKEHFDKDKIINKIEMYLIMLINKKKFDV